MRTAGEFVTLVGETLLTWAQALRPLVTWCCLGWAAHRAAVNVSILLGPVSSWLSMIIFVLGVVAQVMTLVVMIHLLTPKLRTLPPLRAEPAGASTERVPASVLEPHDARWALAVALGPFLAVYALWGLVDDSIRDLFLTNLLRHGGDVESWSVNLTRWPVYAAIAVATWLVKIILGPIVRRTSSDVLRLLRIVVDGLFVFTSFLALVEIGDQVRDWLTGRVVWRWITDGWATALAALPDVELFGVPLDRAVGLAVDWLFGDGLGALAGAILLPLMWLALTAVVYGWQGLDRLPGAEGARWQRAGAVLSGPLAPVGRLAGWATADVQQKYLPVWHALRLVVGVGPRFVGVYLIAATMITTGRAGITRLVDQLLVRLPDGPLLITMPFTQLATDVLFTTLSIALYATAFDRCLAAATGVSRPPVRLRA